MASVVNQSLREAYGVGFEISETGDRSRGVSRNIGRNSAGTAS